MALASLQPSFTHSVKIDEEEIVERQQQIRM